MASHKFVNIDNLEQVWKRLDEKIEKELKSEGVNSINGITGDPIITGDEYIGVSNNYKTISIASTNKIKNSIAAIEEGGTVDADGKYHIIKSVNGKTVEAMTDETGIVVNNDITIDAKDIKVAEEGNMFDQNGYTTIQEALDGIYDTVAAIEVYAAGDDYVAAESIDRLVTVTTSQKVKDVTEAYADGTIVKVTDIYNAISSVNEFNSTQNGAVVNVTQPIKIGEEVFAEGTYVKSNNTLVSINAPKIVDIDLTEYARLDDLKKSRNYAKGTGYALKFDQSELGSSSNANTNTGNCFMYPISGLNQGDIVTVSFDWYYKDEDGIDSAFNQYGEDTGDVSRNTIFVISMGAEYNYGGGPFVEKKNYEQYKISDTEIKGHCSINLSINAGDVNTVSYSYIQNQFVGVSGGAHYLEISNFMVTKGDKEMPWSPAPEDDYGFTYVISQSSSYTSPFKIMPGLYNKLARGRLVNNINCGFRQLASTNNPIPKYIFEWNAGYGTTIVMPNNIKWVNDEAPVFTIGHTYKVTIENNFAECKQIEAEFPEAADFSFPKSQVHKIIDETSTWYYWQANDGDYLYTDRFDLGLVANYQPAAYTDSNLLIRKSGFFNYEEKEVIMNIDDTKKYKLLHKVPGLYIKNDNNYITCLHKY